MLEDFFSSIVWADLWSAFGGTAVALLIAGVLFKFLIAYQFKKELEAFKQNLSKDLIEHETKFSYIYVKRAEVIAKVYENYVNCEDAWKNITMNRHKDIEQTFKDTKAYGKATHDARIYFQLNKIWLPRELASGFEPLIRIFSDVDPEALPKLSDYTTRDGKTDLVAYEKAVLKWRSTNITELKEKAQNLIFDFLDSTQKK